MSSTNDSSPAKKTKLDESSPNLKLSKMLLELADFEKNVNRHVFKSNAYRKASKSVLNFPTKITEKEQIKKLVYFIYSSNPINLLFTLFLLLLGRRW